MTFTVQLDTYSRGFQFNREKWCQYFPDSLITRELELTGTNEIHIKNPCVTVEIMNYLHTLLQCDTTPQLPIPGQRELLLAGNYLNLDFLDVMGSSDYQSFISHYQPQQLLDGKELARIYPELLDGHYPAMIKYAIPRVPMDLHHYHEVTFIRSVLRDDLELVKVLLPHVNPMTANVPGNILLDELNRRVAHPSGQTIGMSFHRDVDDYVDMLTQVSGMTVIMNSGFALCYAVTVDHVDMVRLLLSDPHGRALTIAVGDDGGYFVRAKLLFEKYRYDPVDLVESIDVMSHEPPHKRHDASFRYLANTLNGRQALRLYVAGLGFPDPYTSSFLDATWCDVVR